MMTRGYRLLFPRMLPGELTRAYISRQRALAGRPILRPRSLAESFTAMPRLSATLMRIAMSFRQVTSQHMIL